ncbi:MAG: hypothetical protein ACLQKA_21065, partial [Bryobacteraceae bacterium]
GVAPGWSKRAIRRAAKPEFKAVAEADAETKNTKRTQFGAQHSDFEEHLVSETNPISGQGSRANANARRLVFGWRRGICKDSTLTGARVGQPGFIVTDDHQISEAGDLGMQPKPDERNEIRIFGSPVTEADSGEIWRLEL